MNKKTPILICIMALMLAMLPTIQASSDHTLNVSLIVPEPTVVTPVEEIGLNRTLQDYGFGLAGFLSATTNPLVDFVLALAVIGFILAILYIIVEFIKKSMGKSSIFTESNEKNNPIIKDED